MQMKPPLFEAEGSTSAFEAEGKAFMSAMICLVSVMIEAVSERPDLLGDPVVTGRAHSSRVGRAP